MCRKLVGFRVVFGFVDDQWRFSLAERLHPPVLRFSSALFASYVMCLWGSSDEDHERRQHELSPQSRTRFFIDVAQENRRVFRDLMVADERLRNSPHTSTLYRYTEPLAHTAIQEDIQPMKSASIRVVAMDSLDAAYELYRSGVEDIVVLNMANEEHPGGGYLSGAGAQEEALCRRSSLYATLSGNHTFYPIPPHGAIYSPDVLVIRKSDDEACEPLSEEERWWTSVVSAAAIFHPQVNESGMEFARTEDREDTRERIKTVLRVAALEGKRNLVLSALGCGAFRNPPMAVAQLFKEVSTDHEFQGRFQRIWFSILDRRGSQNYQIFQHVLGELQI